MKRLIFITFALTICMGASVHAATGVLSKRSAAKVDSLMNAGLRAGYYPGATIAVGNSKGVLFDACYGWQDCGKTVQVCPEDVYDLASVTKVASTTLAIMKLYDLSQIRLEDKVGVLLPQFAGTAISSLTLRELLTHTSGLGNISVYRYMFSNADGGALISSVKSAAYPTAVDRSAYLCSRPRADTTYVSLSPRIGYRQVGECCWVNPSIDKLIADEIVKSYKASGRRTYLYSDLNFHLLKLVVEKISGKSLDAFVAPLYAQMRMSNTGYRPLGWKPSMRIIPTEDDRLMQRGLLRGFTHDEIAAVSDNVGGNAGLFSNAEDLSHFCRMLLCLGEFEGERIISQATVKLFTTASPRALGFARMSSNPYLIGGFGHTGYTGTMIWMDASRDLFMVFLSNRVNPTRTNMGLVNSSLRVKIWEAIASGK